MPTRVLDVGNEKCSTVRLVEPRPQAISGPYLTLSHCWGQIEVVKLETTTEDKWQDGISVPELPALYQDAITVCRHLEIRYLWIDSLCIKQDQELDWKREIAAMGEIYSNALCNIEAAYAADALGRLFFSRSQTRIAPLPVTVEWHKDGPSPFFLIDHAVQLENDMNGAPLLKRAWVLQEQLLAKRSIIYSKTQLHWVCRSQEASEMFPKAVPDLREGPDLLAHSLKPRSIACLKSMIASTCPVSFHHWSYGNSLRTSPMENFWFSWRSIVLDYTSRYLTLEKDKLAAIAGVASVIHSKTGIQYIAGMWNTRFHIEYELCWRVSGRADNRRPFRPSKYRAPTWSWASVEGAIWYKHHRDYDLTGDTRLALVEDVKIETFDGTATGPVKSASMQIEGPLRASSCHYFRSDDPAQVIPDNIFYLTMFQLYHYSEVWGLALRRLEFGPNQGCYERIGTFGFSDEGFMEFSSAPKTSITII